MKITKNNNFPLIIYPIAWVVGIVVSLALFFFGPKGEGVIWAKSYALGLITALLNLGLMIRGNRRMARLAEAGIKSSFLPGFLLRLVVFIGVFAAIWWEAYKVPEPIFNIFVAFIGYITLKFIIIVYVLIKREKVNP